MIRHTVTLILDDAGLGDTDVWQDAPDDDTVTVALGSHTVILSGPRSELSLWLSTLADAVDTAKPTDE